MTMGATDASVGVHEWNPGEPLPGVYRGIIVDVSDPLQLKRYQVRVDACHPPEVSNDALPWAEYCGFGGQMFGDFPAFQADDEVWVMFEGANAEYPVIMGGILTQKHGVGSVPMEMRSDYARNRERWVRVDRNGNKMELSPNPDENWVKLQSGDAEITVSQNEKGVFIVAKTQINQETKQLKAKCSEYMLTIDKFGMIQIQDSYTMTAGKSLTAHATDAIFIGEYRDPLWPITPTHTTKSIREKATDLIHHESTAEIRRKAGTKITSECGTEYQHRTGTTHQLQTGKKLTIKVLSEGYDTTVVQGDMTVKVQAGNLDAQVTGNTKIATTGNTEITSMGTVKIHSDVKIEMTAPVIEAKADATFKATAPQSTVEGTAQVEIKGALVKGTASGMMDLKGGGLLKAQAGLAKIN